MTAVPALLFIFLTLPDSAYMSDSSPSTEACQAAKKHDRGPTGLRARSTKSHGTLDSTLKESNWELHKIWTNHLKSHCPGTTVKSSSFISGNQKSNPY